MQITPITIEHVKSAVAMRPDGVDEDILCQTLAGGHHYGSVYSRANRAVRSAVEAGVVRECSGYRLYSIPEF